MKYRVTLPISIGDRIYYHGEELTLDIETATLYRHALIALPDSTPAKEDEHGRTNS